MKRNGNDVLYRGTSETICGDPEVCFPIGPVSIFETDMRFLSIVQVLASDIAFYNCRAEWACPSTQADKTDVLASF